MKDIIKLHDKKFKIMIPAEKIDEAVTAVADRINADYAGCPTPLFVGVLNGSFMFMSDLIKKIDFNNELSFVKLASYEGTSSTGEVKSLIGLNGSLVGRHCRLYLQPEWSVSERVMPAIVEYVKARPEWNISIQTHKYMRIP